MKYGQLSCWALTGSLVAFACGDADISAGGNGRVPGIGSSVADANPNPSTNASSGGTVAAGLSTALSPTGGATLGGAPAVTGECPDLRMPIEPTRPGYTPAVDRDQKVGELLSSMTLDGKIVQMCGVEGRSVYYVDQSHSEDAPSSRGTIRGFNYRFANRGVNLPEKQYTRRTDGKDFSTAFPAVSVRGASWDVELEMQIGEAIGDETMVSMNNVMHAPSADMIRHPYWGRTQDAYGEDTYLIGRMASAFAAGAQRHVVACVTHFAAYNIENNRFNQNAVMDEQTLREIYASSFEMVVRDGGVGCVMAALTSINGKKSTQNKHLLTELLRDSMGFRGFVVSDWWATPGEMSVPDSQTAQANTVEAVKAGLDVELPWIIDFGTLPSLAASESNGETLIEQSAGRVLEQKIRFNTVFADSPFGLGSPETKLDGSSIAQNETHLRLSEEAEIKSAVLLANGRNAPAVLPIRGISSIAVVGLDMDMDMALSDQTKPPATGTVMHYATDVNLGDRGNNRVNADPATSMGPYSGIQAIAAQHGIANVTSGNDVDAAKNADFVVVVVGLSAGDEGEEYSLESRLDRTSLDLPGAQNEFVSRVLELNKPTAIIIESGSIVNVPWLSHPNQKQATIWAGYGGQRAGLALGELLFGDRNFSGKMPLAWPKQEDLPEFRSSDGGNATKYEYFHGYRYYDDQGIAARLVFPFGHGLSYTTFKYENLKSQYSCSTVKRSTESIAFTVDVTNTGAVDGDEVIMLFVSGPPKPSTITGKRPVKELKRFHRVSLRSGLHSRVTLPVRIQDLRHWEGDAKGRWVIDEGEYKVMVGPNAADLQLATTFTLVP